MTLADLSSLGSFISALAVAGSLVYLGLQTHQSVKHTKALIQQGRAARMVDSGHRLADFGHLESYAAFLAGNAIANPTDFMRAYALFGAMMFNAEDTFFQYREGLLNEGAFDTFRGAFGSAMRSKGWLRMWKLRRLSYGAGFRDFVDGMAADAEVYTGPNMQDQWNAMAAETASAVPA